MTLLTISIIIAAIIFILYNGIALGIFGIPDSLSQTYYLYKDKYNKGFLFSVMMGLVVLFMMPAWITLSEGSNLQFLSFLAPTAILFVGASPAFMSNKMTNLVHSISALLAALLSILWIILVTPYWWGILIVLAVFALIAWLTKTYKNAYVYWLESVAFISTFVSTILLSL